MGRLAVGCAVFLGLLLECVTASAEDVGRFARKTYTYKEVGDCRIEADVYSLPGTDIRPALVVIHGGALIVGSREDMRQEAFRASLEAYLKAGFTVIAIDYRLAPETKLSGIIEDVKDAFHWLKEKGPTELHIDPNRIAVLGNSAGGYLTLMTGFCVEPRPRVLVSFYGYGDIAGDWYAKPDEFYRSEGLVPKAEALSGIGSTPITGCRFDTHLGEKRGRFYLYCRQNGLWCNEVVGYDPNDAPEKFTPYCPVRNVTDQYPPTLLLHGDQDTDVPHEQSVAMAEELRRHGVDCELRILKGMGHGFDFKQVGDKWERNDDPRVMETFAEVLAFLETHISTTEK
jgi:acetyl esterase/lipase